MTNKLKEKDVQRVIGKRIREAGGFIHKISDFDVGYKPFDFFGIIAGTPFYIETKMVRGKSFSLSSIRSNQLAALEKIEKNKRGVTNIVSGFAFFIEGRDPSSDIFFLPYEEIATHIAAGEKSVKADHIALHMNLYALLGC